MVRFGVAALFATATLAAGVPASPQEWFAAGADAVEAGSRSFVRPNTKRAKNVIIFVGDGMGVSTVTAARILEGQQRGVDGEFNRLSFERFPYLALSVTASANQQTADSAPTATAMVTGVKTNDGAISVDQRIAGDEADAAVTAARSLKTILERAEERGMSTGIVSTARITHATPATNYAHVAARDWESDSQLPPGATVKDIARQLIEFPYGDGIEVVLGGGRSYFTPRTAQDPEYSGQRGRRSDGRDLTAEWQSRFTRASFIWNKSQLDAVNPDRVDHLLGLFEPSHMKYEVDRTADPAGEPSIADMTRKAIQMLQKNRRGFYLMVEGGRIDHAHHSGNAYRALTEAIAMAEAVKVAREMTSEKDTLIIVTADHSHTLTIAGYPSRGNPILGLAAIDGVPQKDSLGLPYTTLGYMNGPGWTGGGQRREMGADGERSAAAPYAGDKARPDLSGVDTAGAGYMQEAAIPMGGESHGGEDVPIYADGPQAYLFHGVMEQNTIYHVMAEALGFHN